MRANLYWTTLVQLGSISGRRSLFRSSYLEIFSGCHPTNILLRLLNKSLIAKSSIIHLHLCVTLYWSHHSRGRSLTKTKGSYNWQTIPIYYTNLYYWVRYRTWSRAFLYTYNCRQLSSNRFKFRFNLSFFIMCADAN